MDLDMKILIHCTQYVFLLMKIYINLKTHTVIHNLNLMASFGIMKRHLTWGRFRGNFCGIITNGARPEAVQWRKGHWVPASLSRGRQLRSERWWMASDSGLHHAQTGAQKLLTMCLIDSLIMCQGKSGKHLPSLPRPRQTEKLRSFGSPQWHLYSLRHSLWVQVMVELHLLLPEMLDSLPQETGAWAYCLHIVLLQTRWNLLIILQQVHSIPVQPLAQSPESRWEQRRTRQTVQDKDDQLGFLLICPLLLAADLSLW